MLITIGAWSNLAPRVRVTLIQRNGRRGETRLGLKGYKMATRITLPCFQGRQLIVLVKYQCLFICHKKMVFS